MSRSRTQIVPPDEILRIQEQFPGIPSDYLAHLATIGFGKQQNGKILFSGPVHPDEVYGEKLASSRILLFGDDGMGYCFGFDLQTNTFGEFTGNGVWEPWLKEASFLDYLTS